MTCKKTRTLKVLDNGQLNTPPRHFSGKGDRGNGVVPLGRNSPQVAS